MSKRIHRKLADFLEQECLSQEEFAELIGVSQSLVSKWMGMRTKINTERAESIERLTNGKLTRRDLRPDIFYRDLVPES